MSYQLRKDDYLCTTDTAGIDIDATHAYLTRAYWCEGISRDLVAKAVAGSLSFALLHKDAQVGFARAITDRASFAYIADVYVLEAHRGKGLGTWLMHCVLEHPDLQGLRRTVLATRDAHSLYEKFGFTPLHAPSTFMEVLKPGLYAKE